MVFRVTSVVWPLLYGVVVIVCDTALASRTVIQPLMVLDRVRLLVNSARRIVRLILACRDRVVMASVRACVLSRHRMVLPTTWLTNGLSRGTVSVLLVGLGLVIFMM